jgi:hypothetical protein
MLFPPCDQQSFGTFAGIIPSTDEEPRGRRSRREWRREWRREQPRRSLLFKGHDGSDRQRRPQSRRPDGRRFAVRIVRSALAPNVPQADLYVTKPHALFIDGVLVPAGNLINDTTITLYEAREHDELEFFHIKLESHDVIYAEGAPVETLLNVDENAVRIDRDHQMAGPRHR